MERFAAPGLGWHLSLPDFRDYSPDCPAVKEMLARLKPASSSRSRRPRKVDLGSYFPEVYNQRGINSSPAHACVDLVQYFERRVHGRTVELSKLFLYKVARKWLDVTGDTGADLRTVLKAMVYFGIPPERHWPYQVERFDEEPDAFLYSFTGQYRSICYLRLDARNTTGADTLAVVKSFLAAGFPSVFGFSVPGSLAAESDIPYRPTFDRVCGGQAAVAVGYDDQRIGTTKGALLFRNCWGRRWGEDGYGWLPYAYVEQQLALDFWTLLRPDWLESAEFRRPRLPRPATAGPHRAAGGR